MNHPSRSNNLQIHFEKNGNSHYTKMSFPVHCGIFTEVASKEYIFHFNLNGEIIRAKGKGKKWGHPHEWLKRTAGNDWVFYSTGGYTGVFEAIGEYYLPNFRYSSNNLLGGQPFADEEISRLADSWYDIVTQTTEMRYLSPDYSPQFLAKIHMNTPALLEQKAQRLATIIGGRISVLPPDARHVDYNLIPLTLADGCLHKCQFCKVKNSHPFRAKTTDEVSEQIHHLKNLYADDLRNYNALFLGQHDALQANADDICSTIEKAYREFSFSESFISDHQTFLFGSATSLLNAPEKLFTNLAQLPGLFYINIGLESADQETLDKVGKPISSRVVQEAFTRIQEINTRYPNIEVTANFLMDADLPANHYPAVLELIREKQVYLKPKGTIYFSPLIFNKPSRARLFEFNRLKVLSRFPTFLYIIQRL